MAEQDDNWFGSWFNAAKDKSSKVLEFVRKDLEEFGSVVKNEATNVVSSTGTVIEKTLKLDSPDSTASSVKRSFSSFLGQMNTVLNPSPDDSDTEAILVIEDSETVTLNKEQRAIYELQKNAETFVKDPAEDLSKKFECWLEIIDDQLSDERINKHMQSSVVLRNQYEKLVPEIVPHNLFWKRYLFKKALLEDEIAHQEAMEKKEKKEKSMTPESVKWEQGIDGNSVGKANKQLCSEDFAPYIELTEEEQMKLLEEYENEIKKTKGKAVENGKNEDEVGASPKVDKADSAISLDQTSDSSTDDWERISDVDK